MEGATVAVDAREYGSTTADGADRSAEDTGGPWTVPPRDKGLAPRQDHLHSYTPEPFVRPQGPVHISWSAIIRVSENIGCTVKIECGTLPLDWCKINLSTTTIFQFNGQLCCSFQKLF